MPKGSSGVNNYIKNLLSGPNRDAPSIPIDSAQFQNLRTAEEIIQNKSVEYIVVFNNTAKEAEAAFKGNATSVGIPANVNLKGRTITHNHPNKNWGGTLSFADLSTFVSGRAASMRAVGRGREGGYIITATG
ncbi:MAG: hypothetical protein FWG69_06350, partial [Oscillospiraceae bacterium]|nr:hypothetical protein [Oscillospiraceae bacterium]